MSITKKLKIDQQDLEGEVRRLQDELDSLSPTELDFLDGAVAGTVVASKAVVADSSGQVPYVRKVINDGTNVVLTAADSGALIRMDIGTAALVTLPAPVVGLTFKFCWDASYASGTQKIITSAGTVFLKGTVLKFDTDTLTDPLSVETFATDKVAIVIDAVTDGGLLGSWVEMTCVSATIWQIHGILHHSGNVSASASTS